MPAAALLLAVAQIARVDIHSTWGGLGSAPPAHVVIERRGNAYRRGWHRVAAREVDELAAALDANEGDFRTHDWLVAHAEEAFASLHVSSPAKHALFVEAFCDTARMHEVFASDAEMRMDDFPRVEATITFADGHNVVLASKSSAWFMLPWSVTRDGEAGISMNPRISIALSRLMPRGATNRGRLGGEGYVEDLAEKLVRGPIAAQWNIIDSRERIGADFSRVAERFEIVESYIGFVSSVDIERTDDVASWMLLLHRHDLPPNFFIAVSLPFAHGRVALVDRFFAGIDRYIAPAVSGMAAYMRDHPAARVELHFVDDRSLSPKAETWIRANAPPDVLARAGASLPAASFIEAQDGHAFSRWIVLPDGTPLRVTPAGSGAAAK